MKSIIFKSVEFSDFLWYIKFQPLCSFFSMCVDSYSCVRKYCLHLLFLPALYYLSCLSFPVRDAGIWKKPIMWSCDSELQMLLGKDIWREVILVQPPTQSKTIAITSLGQLQLLAFKVCQDGLHLSGNTSWCPTWTCKTNIAGENLLLSSLPLPPSTFRLC